MPVKVENQEETAFIILDGKNECTTITFGLVTAPTTFQRLMDKVLHRLYDFYVAYLEYILLHSLTWEDHFKHLTIVFEKLRVAGIKVKEKTCTFGEASCVYLGYVVGSGEVKPM